MRTKLTFKSNEEWRKERANSIGASAIGTIIGENRFTTPLELRNRMREELNGEFEYSETPAMVRGHAYESGVAYMFEHYSGHQIIKASSAEYLVRLDAHPLLHASPDRTYWIDEDGPKHGKAAEANKGILECKTTRMPVDADNLPLSWVMQLNAQMGICGYDHGCIAWDQLSIADGFGYKFFEFNKELFDSTVVICESFWNDYVIGDNDPQAYNAHDVINLHPNSISGKTITASKEVVDLIASIKDIQQSKKILDKEIDDLKSKVATLFGDEEAIIDPDTLKPLVTFKTTAGRTTVDSKKLKNDYPDVYYEVINQSEPSRTLLIK